MRLFILIALLLTPFYLRAQLDSNEISSLLLRHQKRLDLPAKYTPEYAITDMYMTARLGIAHVYLTQEHRDIPVYNGILNLNLRGSQLVSFGNTWINALPERAPSHEPDISARSAIEYSAQHLQLEGGDIGETGRNRNSLGQDIEIMFDAGTLSREPVPVRLLWYERDGEVHLCWQVEIYEHEEENIWQLLINAHSGSFIRKDNLVRHCTFDKSGEVQDNRISCLSWQLMETGMPPDSSYNVFPMPIESPNHGNRSLVTTPWQDAGMDNPAVTLNWHDDGTSAYTSTRGNNVHAYEDADADNNPGFSPDTANLQFDYPFDPLLPPEENVAAAVTNLFYWNNIVHDVMYQYGFDEVSGNFQNDNLGRGGNGGDYVLAEAQDGGGLNNATFFTPSDGSSGRMQMFLWSPVPLSSPFIVNSPMSIAGEYEAQESDFSNANKLSDVGPVTGDLVLVIDVGDSTHLACGPLSNPDSLAGRIAFIDRGECNFVDKVKSVQDLGAIAAVVVNNVAGSPIVMGGTDNTITIPAVMISLSDGNLIKDVLDTSNVNVTLDTVPMITPDGDFDNGIIVHEYGHGISIRLTGGPSNVSCLNNDEQMGEGWSDYFGLMLTTDWTSAASTDLRGIGTYVQGQGTDGTGIRTYPYSSDTLVNPFTYADIADAPVTSGNVSPHFVGSVWATMLWDMTWNIIDIVGVDMDMYHGTGGNNIALDLVINGLKLQPCSPGFVDARDAILLADEILYGGQYHCAIWEAFAGRGLGIDADQGSADDHEDGTESYDIPGGVNLESMAADSGAIDGQQVTFIVNATCQCEDKTDLLIEDILSEDLLYITGSGGMLNGNAVQFLVDSLGAQDSVVFQYQARVVPCSAISDSTVASDNAEGPDQFESIKLAGNGNKQWAVSNALSVSPSNSWFADDYNTLADIALTLINPVSVTGPIVISFYHRFQTEADYDGGVVEFSTDGGSSWKDAGNYFTENGYTSTINTTGTNSPIAGREAFTGDSDIQFDTTDFVRSTIELCTGTDQSFLLRFRFVCDGAVGGFGIDGWYVDDIVITQRSGVVNKTRVASDSTFIDSLSYCLYTSQFSNDVIYVDQNATGMASGLNWIDAMNDLGMALEIAGCRSTDTVFVAEGTYRPDTSDDRSSSFVVRDSTLVFGGFPPGGGVYAARDPSIHSTLLSGDIGAPDEQADNVYHVVRVNSTVIGGALDGVQITGGNADGTGNDSTGAAVFNEGVLALENVLIHANAGNSAGQIIFNRGAGTVLSMKNSMIFMSVNPIGILSVDSAQLTVDGTTQMVLE